MIFLQNYRKVILNKKAYIFRLRLRTPKQTVGQLMINLVDILIINQIQTIKL